MVMRREIEEKLLEENLEELYENAPCGYISTLPDGTFARVNQTFLTWTGYQRKELLSGKRFQDLLTIQGKIYHETHYAPLLHMQGFVNEIAFDLICWDGQHLPVLINSVQKRDEYGTPRLHRTTLFNASDRRKYEQELLHARRQADQAAQAKARLLSILSHEIRTPLSAISMVAKLLADTDCTPEQEQYIRILKSSSQSVLELLNDILDYSRIEAGKITLGEKSFDIRALINEILYGVKVKAEEKKLSVQVAIDEQVPTYLVGDPVKIGQILTNLLSNAVKFTEKGSVTLALKITEQHPDAVVIDFSVKDTGIGIPSDRLADIFEEFTQASADVASKYGGTGLGLTIVRKLLQLYNSEIKMESVPGEGSTFSFNLCLKKGSEVG